MDCPLCGATLPEARPRHQIALRVSDETRSTETTNDETTTSVQVCEDCWSGMKDTLS